jgi:voltage-gated potassium channel
MLVGIGTIGMVTGSIATYFIGGRDDELPPDVEHVRQRLADWSRMSAGEQRRLAALLHACVGLEPHRALAGTADGTNVQTATP